MKLTINDGSRPSRLELSRRVTGELEADERSRAFAEGLDSPPPFDWERIRAASERLRDLPAGPPVAPKRPWWLALGLLIPLAAALLIFVQTPAGNRTKGKPDLDFFVQSSGVVRPGVEGEALRAGDQLQFTYRSNGLDTLVIVGVDGTGKVSTYWPSSGDLPSPITPGERHVLEGSIVLDAAPGPELFVGVFGPSSVEEARSLVESAYDEGGVDAVMELPRTDPAVDVVRVEKAR